MRIVLDAGEKELLIPKLGLKDDASDADVAAAVVAKATEAKEPVKKVDEPPKKDDEKKDDDDDDDDVTAVKKDDDDEDLDDDDDSVIIVDVAAYRDLTTRAGLSDKLKEDARVQKRDGLIEGAIRVGKFPPARRKHYTERYDSDPEATEKQITRMAKNVVPVEERGHDAAEDDQAHSDDYPRDWAPELAAGQAQAKPERKSRIHSED